MKNSTCCWFLLWNRQLSGTFHGDARAGAKLWTD